MNLHLNVMSRHNHVQEVNKYIPIIEKINCTFQGFPCIDCLPTSLQRLCTVQCSGCMLSQTRMAYPHVQSHKNCQKTNHQLSNHFKLEFGSYVQVHEQHDNTGMVERHEQSYRLHTTISVS